MPWKPIDPDKERRTRQTRNACDARRPRDHNRPYKRAEWQKIREAKLYDEPTCAFCAGADATEVHHLNGDPWDNRWRNLSSACKSCHSALTRRQNQPGKRIRCTPYV